MRPHIPHHAESINACQQPVEKLPAPTAFLDQHTTGRRRPSLPVRRLFFGPLSTAVSRFPLCVAASALGSVRPLCVSPSYSPPRLAADTGHFVDWSSITATAVGWILPWSKAEAAAERSVGQTPLQSTLPTLRMPASSRLRLSPCHLAIACLLPVLSLLAVLVPGIRFASTTTTDNMSTPESWRNSIGPLYTIKTPPFTIDAPGAPDIEGETKPRRHPKAKHGLVTRPHPDVDTVFSLIKRSAEVYATERCLGSRQLLTIHDEVKKVPKIVDGKKQMVDKKWQYFELSGFSFVTYAEYETHLLSLASGLRKLGVERGDKVHMFASTSANWLAISHACSSQAVTIVTAYDTLGASGVEHTLVQSKPKAMFTDPHLLKTAGSALKKADSIKVVIYNDKAIGPPTPQSDIDAFKFANPGLTVLSASELASLGEANPYQPSPPSPQDVYCIMYTSGSTGPPKGVSVTHESFVAGVAGLVSVLEDSVSINEVVLAYLPLAHIFEMVVENLVLFFGATLGYGSTRTLSDNNVRNCVGDMRALAPTVLVGVPQIWETIKKGVIGRVNGSSLLVRSLFWGAVRAKSLLVACNLPGQTIFDSLVFGQVRKLTGGNLRFIINGASGISKETAHFLSMILAPMVGGYGMTETCGNGAVMSPQEFDLTGSCGPVSPAVEVKLVSIAELNYSTSTTPPQGEVLIRGMPVLKEYYLNPEETAKAITPDGWFMTGDIGEFDHVGHLKIIDRVKNLVKLQGGEYIALEKLESVYRSSPAVQNIMVHGDGEHSRPIAIIFVNEPAVKEIAKSAGVNPDEPGLLKDERVVGAVFQDLMAQAKGAGLSGLETVAGVVLTDDEWTPQNVSIIVPPFQPPPLSHIERYTCAPVRYGRGRLLTSGNRVS